MNKIHSTAIVHPKAKLGKDIEIGPYSLIGENVLINDNVKIRSHVVLEGWTTIGNNCKIFESTCIGTPPQDLHYKEEKSFIEIGENNTIREFVTIHSATGEGNKTIIGNNNFIMAYGHIAHNCIVGNNVTMVNGASLGGYVVVEDRVVISAFCPVHQFVRIGKMAMVGLLSSLDMDVPPYMLGIGNPFKICTINKVGLDRAGVSLEDKEIIKKIYKLIYRSGLNVSQALEKIKTELPQNEYVKHFIEFVESSKRGIYR
ncbi:MAG: acyl-ACP--UDP-N-acetylglucosamine O-acyltransferase [Candidatus Firestonebacteria bacterium]